MHNANDVLDLSPVVPVVALDDLAHAEPLAEALLRGGLRTIEVTLRTEAALAVIERLATKVPDIVVGAGTITQPGQANQAVRAGARYLVTPGCTDRLLDDVEAAGVPVLPGASTVSEVMRLVERGHRALKFFPAEASGGVAALKSIAGPLPAPRFCPTGGITPETAPTYLALPNVGCVGGTWMTSSALLAAGDWGQIEALARQASELR